MSKISKLRVSKVVSKFLIDRIRVRVSVPFLNVLFFALFTRTTGEARRGEYDTEFAKQPFT